RRVARFECETLLPKLGAFPHRSQTDDTEALLYFVDKLNAGRKITSYRH
ncbi:MAG: hypothetical protein RI887_298, partial [Actinomycetota bacterium]